MTTVRDVESGGGRPAAEPASPPRRRWRWVVPALMIVAWLLVGGGLGPISQKTSEVQRNDNSSYLPQSAESTKVQQEVTRFTQTQTLVAIVVYARDSGLTPADWNKVRGDVHQNHAGDFGRMA